MKLSDKAQASLDKVIDRFKQGDLSAVTTIARLKRDEPVPFDAWSFNNRILALAQTGSTDCRGYRQWQKVERQVRKGEKAAYILGPMTIKKTDEETREETFVLIGFKAIAVFSYDQTDGEPLPESQRLTPNKPLPLADVAEALGIGLKYETFTKAPGSCTIDGATVTLHSHEAEVFFHELGHAVDAKMNGQLRGGQHADQETIAELTAAVLSHLYTGTDITGNAWQYIDRYNADPLKAIMQAMSDVGEIVAYIESIVN